MDNPATAASTGTARPPDVAPPPPVPAGDERLAKISPLARLLRRPEIGALLAAIVVAIFFWTQNSLFLKLDGIANWTDVASTIGIPAVVVALLMIGGEFDLSAGVMTGSAGLMMGILATEVGHERLAGDRAHADRGGRRRLHQRLHGHDDEAAELHRHAGDVLHPPGRQPRRDEGDHEPGRGQRTSTPPPATTSANKIFGGSFWSPHDFRITVLWWIAITVARHLGPRAHARRATGSSASAATPTPRATSASRSPA